jgi:uncharacterized protein RhaS with RHS repeats
MRARYYDADIGRFISEDPIGFEGGLNLYAYVGGNPIMFVDPNGFSAERIGISQAQIAQFQQDAFDIAIGFALPVSKAESLIKGAVNKLGRTVSDTLPKGITRVSKDAVPVSSRDIIDATRPGAQRTGGN